MSAARTAITGGMQPAGTLNPAASSPMASCNPAKTLVGRPPPAHPTWIVTAATMVAIVPAMTVPNRA